jgi:F-type H+-transporting ATPase subunit a
LLAIEFPPISHLLNWPAFWMKDNEFFAVNKVAFLMVLGAIAVAVFYFVAGSKKQLIPSGAQNIAEMAVDFVRDGIVLETAGPDAMPFMPLLLTLFSFIFALNLFEIIPIAQMPPNARIALPMFMAVLVWAVYNVVGMIKQGPLHYFKAIAFPPGVPKPIYLLVTPIEIVSVLFVRPLSLAVRLFANMLAGHLILVSFAILADTLFKNGIVGVIGPFPMLVALTGFELLVAFLQAYIFTILTSVYIGGALHPDH